MVSWNYYVLKFKVSRLRFLSFNQLYLQYIIVYLLTILLKIVIDYMVSWTIFLQKKFEVSIV